MDDLAEIGKKNEQWILEGRSAEWRAQEAFNLRKAARCRARAQMDPDRCRLLEERDLAKYGHPDGPTFEELLDRAHAKGLQGDAAYEDVIRSSQRSDPGFNQAALGGD